MKSTKTQEGSIITGHSFNCVDTLFTLRLDNTVYIFVYYLHENERITVPHMKTRVIRPARIEDCGRVMEVATRRF